MFFNKRQIIGLIFFVFIGIYLVYYHGLVSLGIFLAYVILVSIIVYLWRLLKKKERHPLKILAIVLYRFFISIIILLIIVGGISFFGNEIKPAQVSKYTLTNGEKTVIFQGMSHIAFPHFYETIAQDITEKKQNGYVLFWEGVRPGEDESYEILDQAMGVKFDESLYDNMSKLLGVTMQKHEDFLGRVNNKDYNTDITIDELASYYKETDSYNNEKAQIQDVSGIIDKMLEEMTPLEMRAYGYYQRAIMNLVLMNETITQYVQNEKADFFNIILDKRNESLAQHIINTQENKIYVTYGMLHFEGTFELLKENDPRWKIIEKKEMYPLKK